MPGEAQVFLDGTPIPVQPGECWYLRLSDPHTILNGSAEVRTSMSIDMEPNPWVRSLVDRGGVPDAA